MKQVFTRVAVKIGSNVLTRRDGTLDVTRMSALVDQIAELHKSGVEIILISSGAVASGRSEVSPQKKLDSVDQRQLFSAVGQAKLINRYYELFREHNIPVGQVYFCLPPMTSTQRSFPRSHSRITPYSVKASFRIETLPSMESAAVLRSFMETLIAPPANAILATELITLVLPATSSSLSRRTRQIKSAPASPLLHCSRSSFAMLGIAMSG